MVRRWPAVACAVLLAAGCRSSSSPTAADGAPTGSPSVTAAGAEASVYQAATTLGMLRDPDIGESSGLVASRRSPGALWTHNDSGDEPYLYCLDARIASCGVWRVAGADAFDWEDIAMGPGPRPGEQYLYVGDIGDNIGQRREIVVYRVPEPAAGRGGAPPTKAAPAVTMEAERLRLRYPDGPKDAEALLVHPATGDVYVVTKSASETTVYRAAAPLSAATITSLRPVGTVRLGTGVRGPEAVTGGDISPDGTRVALVTYASGYELVVPTGAAFDAVWDQTPAPVDLGLRLQGESVAYRLDGRALLSTSEMIPSPVQQVERR